MRRQVLEIECSRCRRVEHRPSSEPTLQEEGTEAFQAVLMVGGKPAMRIIFEELCTPCMKTVKNHLEAIDKKIKGASPARQSKPVFSSVVELGAKKKA